MLTKLKSAVLTKSSPVSGSNRLWSRRATLSGDGLVIKL